MVNHVLESMNEVISNDYSGAHQAVDIISEDHASSDIIALESGIAEEVVKNIKYTDHNSTGNATYGNYIKIRQNNGKTALYAHMKYGSINANKGDYIEKGSIIGTMGQTGNAYGNHLHLEIKNENGLKENPITYLNTASLEKTLPTDQQPTQEQAKESTNEPQKENIPTIESSNQENITTSEENKVTDSASSKEENKKNDIEYISNVTYFEGSIVDGLKEIGIDSSYDHRKILAEKNGIKNYRGSYEQNITLLRLLKKGKLIKA